MARTGAMLEVLPEVCEHARNGRVPVDHLDDLGRIHANERVRDHLVVAYSLVQANPDPLGNIIINDDTADRLMRLIASEDTAPPSPLTFRKHRCETIDGVPLSDESVIGAMLTGGLRRVLVTPDGVVIDLGRS